jgi:serine protease Do
MTDLAVLKLDAGHRRLASATLGDSDALQVGDWVLALGSPFTLEFTVTAGIISAKGRQLPGPPTALQSFLQTDAAINPGNSGGPLVDLTGRVVGVNTAIVGGRGFVGYGFAIPVNLVKKVVQDILQYGEVRRPQLGVQIAAVTEADAEVYGLPEIRGAKIAVVQPGSPAARAGIRIGDVVLALDGEPIRTPAELTTRLARHQPGDRVRLTLFRDKQESDVTVELGRFEAPEDGEAARRSGAGPVEEALGFEVQPLTSALAQQYGLDRTRGVVVSQVSPLSSAATSGVQRGMVVLSINGKAVESVADVQRIAAGLGAGQVVSLRGVVPGVGETVINYRVRG